MTPRTTVTVQNVLSDEERVGLTAYCCLWLAERYSLERIPVLPEQIFFYDHTMDELLPDEHLSCLQGPGLLTTLLRSIAWGAGWTLLLALCWQGSDTQVLFWCWSSMALLMVFPVLLLYRRRKIAEVHEEDSATELTASLGMACFHSCLLRRVFHAVADIMLLPAFMSYSGAVRLRMETEYAEQHGVTDYPANRSKAIPIRWQRGLPLLQYLENHLHPNGFRKIIQWG